MTLLATQRASRMLVVLLAWGLLSSLTSLYIVRLVYTATQPVSQAIALDRARGINEIQDLTVLKKIAIALVESTVEKEKKAWLLVSWGIGFVITWSIIYTITFMFVYRQLQVSNATETILDAAFAGTLELRKAFWGLYVVLPLVAAIIIFGLLAVLKSRDIVEPNALADLLLTPMAFSAVLVIYWSGAIVAWRCSVNTSRAVWRHLARLAIILITIIPLGKAAIVLGYTYLTFMR